LLTQQILYEVKGAPDGMLTISPNFTGKKDDDKDTQECTFNFYNETDYPLIDASIGIVGTRYLEFPTYARKIGDVRPRRGGTLLGLTVAIPKDKDKHSRVDFSIDSRSVTMWESVYFAWNGKGWIIDWTIFKEVDGREVYLRVLRPNSPFAAEVAQQKQWAKETADQKEQFEQEQGKSKK
ncbi:MAG TPA: hypothetical protein VH107_08795, partial [Lacipirellulaceae bacterium]|nr:hypothetical protein [Lacipirellulaceae bacterium]